jgi:hypothetical protein
LGRRVQHPACWERTQKAPQEAQNQRGLAREPGGVLPSPSSLTQHTKRGPVTKGQVIGTKKKTAIVAAEEGDSIQYPK